MDKLMQYSEANWHPDEASNNMHQKHSEDDHTSRLRVQLSRFRQILNELDGDGSGEMEWEEFVDFFRRCGLLLEYQVDTHLNHTGLDTVALELDAARTSEARLGSKDSRGKSDSES